MESSSVHCRAQEARQRELAANATLDNVRDIATNAANAWHREALSADRREARRETTRLLVEQRALDAAAAMPALAEQPLDEVTEVEEHQWNEYPDTGRAATIG